ncbi:MAG TPA: glycoside hydrolase family 88 protein [Acidobacteriaceae bacterium]
MSAGIPLSAAVKDKKATHAVVEASTRDLSRIMVDSTIARYPNANSFGQWAYFTSLYLFGQYMVYMRTGDEAYLNYIHTWIDSHVNSKGGINHEISGLDYMQPGNVLLLLYASAHDERYRIAANTIRTRYDTYPRTRDGGFWHSSIEEYKQHELWLDGTYMALPFLLRYARLFGGEDAACDTAVQQLLLDYLHNHSTENGLLYHAYDERGQAPWAQPGNHHSSVFWSRSIGWYSMALVDVLDVLPKEHPHRDELISILQKLVTSLADYQDAKTGLWYQVLDQPSLAGNWTETSSSCMFVYAMDVAIKRGHVGAKYRAAAARGYAGILTQISIGADGLLDIHNICEGTDVGDTAYYLARKRNTNDPHGLGSFLIMNEEWNHSTASMAFPH